MHVHESSVALTLPATISTLLSITPVVVSDNMGLVGNMAVQPHGSKHMVAVTCSAGDRVA